MITSTTDPGALDAVRIIVQAAGLIRRDGYYHYGTYQGEGGWNVQDALCTASGCGASETTGLHNDDCDAIGARVGGYLYLAGRVGPYTPAGSWIPGALIHWESELPGQPEDGADALAILDGAARAIAGTLSQATLVIPLVEERLAAGDPDVEAFLAIVRGLPRAAMWPAPAAIAGGARQ